MQVELDDRGLPVAIKELGEGEEVLVRSSGAGSCGAGRAVCGTPAVGRGKSVEEIIQTWRIDDEWWREPITRRYIEVVLKGGGHVVLFEDLHTGQWFAQRP